MGYQEELAKQLEDILVKQKEVEINNDLARICKELGSFTPKIKECAEKFEDLPQADKIKIQELTDEYNGNFDKYKKLKGLE